MMVVKCIRIAFLAKIDNFRLEQLERSGGTVERCPIGLKNLDDYFVIQPNKKMHRAGQFSKKSQMAITSIYLICINFFIQIQSYLQRELLKNAQQYFHLVGGSTTECDTIPGRQCMASALFLYGQFEEVLVYLNSIRSFFVNDDVFNYNYAQVCNNIKFFLHIHVMCNILL